MAARRNSVKPPDPPAESSSFRFARIPLEILSNPHLTSADIRLFGILAATARQTNIAAIGQRLLSQLSTLDRRTVRRSLDNLARQGYISKSIFKLGGRNVYQLNHPLFKTEVGTFLRPLVGTSTRPRIEIEKGNEEKLLSFPRSARQTK